MQITLIAIGKNMPRWINDGFQTYAERMPTNYRLKLLEISSEKRHKSSDINKILKSEGEKLLRAIPEGDIVVALDRVGKSLKTTDFAEHLKTWHDQSMNLSILIGGPEGLSEACFQRADHCWSLSALTLPHPLVRIVVAEQCYRAYSIITNHPYHR